MSPWTALLESLHSALIDELNARLPKLKPELGMPMRSRDLGLPSPELKALLAAEIIFVREEAVAAAATAGGTESRGMVLLACDPECLAKLGIPTREMWDAILKRAGQEFMVRKIQPRVGHVTEIIPPIALPQGFAVPARVIWIPFRLNPGSCYLGVGA